MNDDVKEMVKSPAYRVLSFMFGILCTGIVINSGVELYIIMMSMSGGICIMAGVKGQ